MSISSIVYVSSPYRSVLGMVLKIGPDQLVMVPVRSNHGSGQLGRKVVESELDWLNRQSDRQTKRFNFVFFSVSKRRRFDVSHLQPSTHPLQCEVGVAPLVPWHWLWAFSAVTPTGSSPQSTVVNPPPPVATTPCVRPPQRLDTGGESFSPQHQLPPVASAGSSPTVGSSPSSRRDHPLLCKPLPLPPPPCKPHSNGNSWEPRIIIIILYVLYLMCYFFIIILVYL